MGLKIRTYTICKWEDKVDILMLDKEDTPTDFYMFDCYVFRIHNYRPDLFMIVGIYVHRLLIEVMNKYMKINFNLLV